MAGWFGRQPSITKGAKPGLGATFRLFFGGVDAVRNDWHESTSLVFYNNIFDYYEAKVFLDEKKSSTAKALPFEEDIQEIAFLKLLKSLDNWSYRIIGLGFPFLTIGIIAGGVWANEAWGSYWSWDPKETWALITWLVFATYLHSRITKGWEGKKTAILGGLGFFVIWVCYLGVNFLGKGLHSYGWLS